MRLSVFPLAKVLPKSKEEKRQESFKVSKPYKPEIRDFSTEDELVELVTSNTWSPFVFKEYRSQEDFISTDLIAFDIDSGMTIEEAEEIIHELDITALCLPSTSHTKEDHRFRLILPTSRTIFNPDVYRATYAKYAEFFSVDPACKDLARFYFGSTMNDGFYFDSKLLEPVRVAKKSVNSPRKDFDMTERVAVGEGLEELVEALYGEPREKVPEGIAYFLKNAPDNLSGEWFHSSNRFLFTCGLSGLEYDRITDVFFSLYPYDELTPQRVDKMINDGYEARDKELDEK